MNYLRQKATQCACMCMFLCIRCVATDVGKLYCTYLHTYVPSIVCMLLRALVLHIFINMLDLFGLPM